MKAAEYFGHATAEPPYGFFKKRGRACLLIELSLYDNTIPDNLLEKTNANVEPMETPAPSGTLVSVR